MPSSTERTSRPPEILNKRGRPCPYDDPEDPDGSLPEQLTRDGAMPGDAYWVEGSPIGPEQTYHAFVVRESEEDGWLTSEYLGTSMGKAGAERLCRVVLR